MDHETNLLPELADTPTDMDAAAVSREIEAAVEEAAAPIRERQAPEGAAAAALEETAASASAPAVAEETPVPAAEEAKGECSFLLDSEISALLGPEVSAILEADWARANGRSVPAKAAPAVTQAPKKAAEPEAAQAVSEPKSAKAKTDRSQKAEPAMTGEPQPLAESKKKRSLGAKIFCFARRTLLLILVVALLAVAAAAMACHAIFNGPSQDAREMLYNTFMEPSGTKWIPGLFLSKAEIDAIENKQTPLPPAAEISGQVTININTNTSLNGENDEWKDHPDGIRIEHITGESYTAHVMIIRDPSRVYLGTSNRHFSTQEKPGMRLNVAIDRFDAVAAINAGAFWDDGKGGSKVGTVPEGLTISQGDVLWNEQDTYTVTGFAGFTQDHVLVVARYMTAAKARELGIRDGVGFGPVLIVDGKSNAAVYNDDSGGQNPRTCIAQRADGAVIFLCIDGRQASSLGGTYADCIDILMEYGAVNACNLDGGSSSAMFYRDVYGKYKDKGEVFMVNNYSLLQSNPRRMPTFFLVAPQKEGE